jgi:hypothetical protein
MGSPGKRLRSTPDTNLGVIGPLQLMMYLRHRSIVGKVLRIYHRIVYSERGSLDEDSPRPHTIDLATELGVTPLS